MPRALRLSSAHPSQLCTRPAATSAPLVALINASATTQAKAEATDIPVISATPDSGCTGSCTDKCSTESLEGSESCCGKACTDPGSFLGSDDAKCRGNVWHPEREAASSDRSVFSREFRLKM